MGWSLHAAEDGSRIHLTAWAEDQAAEWLSAPIQWRRGQWHLITLAYSPEEVLLHIDDKLAAIGPGWPATPGAADGVLAVGSTVEGLIGAQGAFDEVTTFDYVIDDADLRAYYLAMHRIVGRRPPMPDDPRARGRGNRSGGDDGGEFMMMSGNDGPPTPGNMEGSEVVVIQSGQPAYSISTELCLLPPVFTGSNSLVLTAINANLQQRYDVFAVTNIAATNWKSG